MPLGSKMDPTNRSHVFLWLIIYTEPVENTTRVMLVFHTRILTF